MKTRKITIESNIHEQDFIEGLLNMKHSGTKDNYILICMTLHSMANKWKYDKVIYYLNLLEIKWD